MLHPLKEGCVHETAVAAVIRHPRPREEGQVVRERLANTSRPTHNALDPVAPKHTLQPAELSRQLLRRMVAESGACSSTGAVQDQAANE